MTIQVTFLTTALISLLAFLPFDAGIEHSFPDSVRLDERQFIIYARIENASFHPATAAPSVTSLVTRISFPLFLAISLIATVFIGYAWRIRSGFISGMSSEMETKN